MTQGKKPAFIVATGCVLTGAALLGIFAVPVSAWYDKTHVFIMIRAAKLMEAMDRKRPQPLYTEIYGLPTLKIMAKGVSDEDYIPDVRGNARSFRHYYDPDAPEGQKGVPFYQHYYAWRSLEGAAVTPPKSGYYEGTMEWVRSINWGNPLNWPGAIHAYNYTKESRAEAFSRLGRVVHLLGDMADVDHATNTPHAGSGKILPDTLEEILGPAVQAQIESRVEDPVRKLALKIMVSQAYAMLRNRFLGTDPQNKLIGYEGLVEDFVSFDLVRDVFPPGDMNRVRKGLTPNPPIPPIGGAQPVKFETIEPYFDTLARRSKEAAKEYGLTPAIGCLDLAKALVAGAVVVSPFDLGPRALQNYEPVYIIPNIKLYDQQERDHILSMAWSVIRDSVEFNAGLMEMFLDIVNQPPYVRKIIVEQDGGPGRYSAEWEDVLAARTIRAEKKPGELHQEEDREYPVVTERELVRGESTAFESGKSSDIMLTFGPEVGDVREMIDAGRVVVTVGGMNVPGRMIDDLTWKGSFIPELAEGEPGKTLRIEIEAADVHEHYPRPGQSLPDHAYALDADPATPAFSHYLPPYEMKGYKPGADTTHGIAIKRGEERRTEPEAAPAAPEDDVDARIRKLRELARAARPKFFVWINRPPGGTGGRVHVGDKGEYEAAWRFKDERFFGLSAEPLDKVLLGGPFETRDEALKLACGMIGGIIYRFVPGWGSYPGTMYGGVFHWVDSNIAGYCPKER